MEFSLIKLIEMFKSPAQWLYKTFSEQTKIAISGQESNEQINDALFISASNAEKEGNLIFCISTTSKLPVEILKVEIEYSPPLQLFDPKKMGFFEYAASRDETFPFSICCHGSYEVHSDLKCAFALTARFPSGARELPVRISVHARVLATSMWGFTSLGRTRVTKKFYRLVLSNDPLRGVVVPPKHRLTSSQPYLIQSASYVSGDAISVLIHEQMEDGSVSSKIFESSREK